jgi:hypothetical protein
LTNFSSVPTFSQFFENALNSSNVPFWQELYNEIHVANAVLEGLSASGGVTAKVRGQLTGEAKFMRAFFLFYAVNLFGDVPLVTTTNYQVDNTITRMPKAQVYLQLIQDLKDAQSLLSDNFLDAAGNPTSQRVRPNRGAATALLARAYLYNGNWDSAEVQASLVIDHSLLYSLDTLNGVFLKNSTESIWQLQPNQPGYNTFDAYYFVLSSLPGTGNGCVAVSTNLLNVFEQGDNRLVNWIGIFTADSVNYYYYPNKYKVYIQNQPVTEYLMVLRLAEQYLIRAEARARLGNIGGAQADLNKIRFRAGLPYTSSGNQLSLLASILHERQVELFTEWGHRWFDLKRTGNVDGIMSLVTPLKNGSWNPDWALMPLPLSEIKINPNLKQNPGY